MANAMRVLVVEARFYDDIADELAAGALAAIEAAGGRAERVQVPGALEIPAAIQMAEDGGLDHFDAYVALGCVIRGETSHYDYVCGESARGLMDVALFSNVALGNGILTVENRDQAWARADRGQKNKGGDAAEAAIAMARLKTRFFGEPA